MTPLRDFLSHYLTDPMSTGTMYYAAKVRLLKWYDRADFALRVEYRWWHWKVRNVWWRWTRTLREAGIPVTSTRPVPLAIVNAKLLRLKDAALIAMFGLLVASVLANIWTTLVYDRQIARAESQAAEAIAHERHLNTLSLSALDDAIEKAETAIMLAETADARADTYRAAVGALHGLTDRLQAENRRLREKMLAARIEAVNPDADAETLAKTMIEASRLHGVPVEYIRAVSEIESHYDPDAVSVAGARGVMQVMPEWETRCPALDTVSGNLHCGTRILAYECRRADSLETCLDRYSGGARGYAGKFMQALARAE